ncbi:MAG: hypothetical protein ACRDQX_03850 [Pseudonocardiaceae bacterium]
MTRRKVPIFPMVLTEQVFDKIRSIDMALAEFEQLLGCGEVIEERATEPGRLKELVLVIEWKARCMSSSSSTPCGKRSVSSRATSRISTGGATITAGGGADAM